MDVIGMKKIIWDKFNSQDGKNFTIEDIDENDDQWLIVSEQREKLIENIADLDDLIAEKFINDSHKIFTENELNSAIRRITLKRAGIPVFCGSSYKNIAVQLLMDAIIKFLPNPNERSKKIIEDDSNLYAIAFKIIHDKKRGPLTFLRLYSGSVENGKKIYNVQRSQFEKISSLMVPLANNFKEVSSVSSGNIVTATGLKTAITGDIFISQPGSIKLNDKCFYKFHVPDPVFFCTIEPPSPSLEKQLEYALKCLEHEDPTFRVDHDEELGQVIISGMGELHIDIIKERIRREYGVDAFLGDLQIAYREFLDKEVSYTHVQEKNLGNVKQFVKITLAFNPDNEFKKFEQVKVIVTKDNDLGKIYSDHLKAINTGIRNSLMHGPILGFPVIGIKVSLLWFEAGKGTSLPMISAAASSCVMHVLQNSNVRLLEPIMKLSITAGQGSAGRILNELSQKRSQILNMENRGDIEVIEGLCPLSELMGFSTDLRAMTSGNCTFTLEFDSYEVMDIIQQSKAVEKVTGFAPL